APTARLSVMTVFSATRRSPRVYRTFASNRPVLPFVIRHSSLVSCHGLSWDERHRPSPPGRRSSSPDVPARRALMESLHAAVRCSARPERGTAGLLFSATALIGITPRGREISLSPGEKADVKNCLPVYQSFASNRPVETIRHSLVVSGQLSVVS